MNIATETQQNEQEQLTYGLAMVQWLIYHGGQANQKSRIALSNDLVFCINITCNTDHTTAVHADMLYLCFGMLIQATSKIVGSAQHDC